MAAVNAFKGQLMALQIGDGAEPEVFGPFCSINAERGISFTAETNDVALPDCTDLELVDWIAREKVSLSAGITGSGMLDKADVPKFYAFLADTESRGCRLTIPGPGGTLFAGKFHLTGFEITGARNERSTCSITLASDGPVTATPIT
jgi:predicted secreted protein